MKALVIKPAPMKKILSGSTRLWAKREEQLHGVLEATAGMYGDLQGIAGKSLNEIEGLEVVLLPVVDDVR